MTPTRRTLTVHVEIEIEVVADGHLQAQEALAACNLTTDPEVLYRARVAVEESLRWGGDGEIIAWDEGGNCPIYLGEMKNVHACSAVEPVRDQGQIVSDMEMARQAARDGYNPTR